MTRMTCIPIGLALLLAVQTAWAGDVALEVSAREVSVNEPVTVQIRVINAERHDPPEFPEIPGAVVRSMGTPTRSSQTSIINGRMTQQTTMIYSYRITPRRAGKIAIPPIAVRVDGRRLQTAATTILVTDSGVETTDLLFLDLVADRDTVYLGESINVDLEIWVRPYRDGNVRMDPEQMLSRIDLDGSQWGAFRDTIIRLQHGSPGFRWRYREAVRADSTGTDRAYYVFVVPLEFVPTTTGPLDVGDVDVVVSYPTQTGRSRDIFFSVFDRYQVTRARPIAASLDESEITVLAPPAEGQPEYFNGAVGNYQFTAKAGNTDVRVREPIELTLTITGDGVLDRVSPPPLNQVEELTRDFKVPTENIAGVVEQNSKRFTMKISAKHADVTEIPAIPFSFFQPQAQRYVTLWSDPIPLDVEASDQVSLAQFAESANGNRTGQAKLTETAVGIRANYGHMDDVLAQQAFDPGWGTAAILGGSPLAFAVCALVHRRRNRLLYDHGYARRRKAATRAMSAVKSAARQEDAAEAVSGISAAVIHYVCDRCNSPVGLTRTEVIDELTRRGLSPQRVQHVEQLLSRCETLQYAGQANDAPADLATDAKRCIQELERERF